MDLPIRPKPCNLHKPRIRVIRDSQGFTRYQVSIKDSIFVESLEFRGAWKWALIYAKQQAAFA
ncbi:hypothetical protein IM816_05675 [Luteibacter flocculans]|uniref:Uncharacterized protein n=1 Tax=Luteibacter flocculans TaxID=2780091 RepID=A0ABY4T4G1_9GAMM|nr:hypothetical protein [Luteibacter flocculans]URL59585.1 hypothetical protein IM816_05675 [Luteibacter flocculans]